MNYPNNPMIDPDMTFKPEAISALRAFKGKKTFKLSLEERFAAMKDLVDNLADVYELEPVELKMENIDGSFSGGSSYNLISRTITMRGKLSIITLLHEFGHARFGADEFKAVRFSVNLFRKVYPSQFNKLIASGHCMVLPSDKS